MRSKVLSAIVALFMALAALVAGVSSASADTPAWTVSHVYMNIGDTASQTQQSQYSQLISSLRAATGHAWRNGVMLTQLPLNHSLIRMDLARGDARVVLWFEPDNLYLRGFTTADGATFSFNDLDLRGYMASPSSWGSTSNLLPPAASGGTYYTLPFSSNYNNLVQVAGRSRDNMPITWNDFWNSFYNLAYADQGTPASNQAIARDLLFMIQYTSEAARFNDTFGVMSAIMGSTSANYTGLRPSSRRSRTAGPRSASTRSTCRTAPTRARSTSAPTRARSTASMTCSATWPWGWAPAVISSAPPATGTIRNCSGTARVRHRLVRRKCPAAHHSAARHAEGRLSTRESRVHRPSAQSNPLGRHAKVRNGHGRPCVLREDNGCPRVGPFAES